MDEDLLELAADDRLRAVVLTGAGPKAFIAGVDINEMARICEQAFRGAKADLDFTRSTVVGIAAGDFVGATTGEDVDVCAEAADGCCCCPDAAPGVTPRPRHLFHHHRMRDIVVVRPRNRRPCRHGGGRGLRDAGRSGCDRTVWRICRDQQWQRDNHRHR